MLLALLMICQLADAVFGTPVTLLGAGVATPFMRAAGLLGEGAARISFCSTSRSTGFVRCSLKPDSRERLRASS